MEVSNNISEYIPVSSLTFNKQKVVFLRDISQTKHINRIRKAAENKLQNNHDRDIFSSKRHKSLVLNNQHILPSNNRSQLINFPITHTKSETKPTETERFPVIENKPVYGNKNKSSNSSEELLYKCTRNSSKSKTYQDIKSNSSIVYDIHQMKHICRIRSVSNHPVSCIVCDSGTSRKDSFSIKNIQENFENVECSLALQSGDTLNLDSPKNTNARKQSTNRKSSKLSIKTHIKKKNKETKAQNCNESSNNSNESEKQECFRKKSEINRPENHLSKTRMKTINNCNINHTKLKQNHSKTPNPPKNYRENIASTLRKERKIIQCLTSDDKMKRILRLSKNIRKIGFLEYERDYLQSCSLRTSNNTVSDVLSKKKKVMELNYSKKPTCGEDGKMTLYSNSTMSAQSSQQNNKKRKTWASSIRGGKSKKKRGKAKKGKKESKKSSTTTKIDKNTKSLFSENSDLNLISIFPDETGEYEKDIGLYENGELGDGLKENSLVDDNLEKCSFDLFCELGELISANKEPEENLPDTKPLFEFPTVTLVELVKDMNPNRFQFNASSL